VQGARRIEKRAGNLRELDTISCVAVAARSGRWTRACFGESDGRLASRVLPPTLS